MDVIEIGPDESLLPYDDEAHFPGFVGRLWNTSLLLLTRPMRALDRVPNAYGSKDGFSFLLAIAWPLSIATETVRFFSVHSTWLRSHGFPDVDPGTESPLNLILSLLFAPVAIWLGFWAYVAINHASLWLWRGLDNRHGMHQTARALGFTGGVLALIDLPLSIFFVSLRKSASPFPFLLPRVLVPLLVLTYLGIALAKAHRTQVWRGIAASCSPTLAFLATVSLVFHWPLRSFLFR